MFAFKKYISRAQTKSGKKSNCRKTFSYIEQPWVSPTRLKWDPEDGEDGWTEEEDSRDERASSAEDEEDETGSEDSGDVQVYEHVASSRLPLVLRQ